MLRKKISAGAALLCILSLFAHVLWQAYAYYHFLYNPLLTKVLGYISLGLAVLHGALSMYGVLKDHDGNRLGMYPAANARTIAQRVSAVLMLLLLLVHINTFGLLKSHAGQPFAELFVVVVELLFFTSVLTHVATSFTRALITMGWLTSRETQRRIDYVVWAVCAVGGVVSAFIIIRTQWAMFMG